MTLEEARQEGVEAAKAGVPRSACPYLGWLSAMTGAWWEGWDQQTYGTNGGNK